MGMPSATTTKRAADRVAGLDGRVDLGDHGAPRRPGPGSAAASARGGRAATQPSGMRVERVVRAGERADRTELVDELPDRARRQAARSWRHTAPAATRGAVERAEARSSTSRMSSVSYLMAPARSAWPGRASVIGFGRARAGWARPPCAPASSTQSRFVDREGEGRAERPAVAQPGGPASPGPARCACAGRCRSRAGGAPARGRHGGSRRAARPAGRRGCRDSPGPCDSPAVSRRSRRSVIGADTRPPGRPRSRGRRPRRRPGRRCSTAPATPVRRGDREGHRDAVVAARADGRASRGVPRVARASRRAAPRRRRRWPAGPSTTSAMRSDSLTRSSAASRSSRRPVRGRHGDGEQRQLVDEVGDPVAVDVDARAAAGRRARRCRRRARRSASRRSPARPRCRRPSRAGPR